MARLVTSRSSKNNLGVNMKIICISGKALAGKDTSAGIIKKIIEEKEKSVLIIHNADLLKYICKSIFEWDGNKDEHGRTLLQHIGTDIIRKQRPDFWVKFVTDIVNIFHDNWDYVLIPDCRFPNEIDYLRSNTNHRVYHFRVERPNFDNGLSEEQKNHPSETSLDGVEPDINIINDGTIDDLKNKLFDLVKTMELIGE